MSSLIWNGTVQHSLRTLNTSPLRSHRSSGHASSPDTRSFRSFVHSPSSPRTNGPLFLKSSHRLAWRCTCWRDFTPAKWQRLLLHQPTLLHYCEIPDHSAVRSGLLASGWSYAGDIDTHDFTVGDWFWVVKHSPRLWNHCPCQDQFTKPMWWSILFSSAELLTACPCLDQFSDEDWRRLNILPKLQGRLHTSDQFRKLVELTIHPVTSSLITYHYSFIDEAIFSLLQQGNVPSALASERHPDLRGSRFRTSIFVFFVQRT